MEDTRAIMNQQKPSSLVEDTPAIMKKLQLKSSLFRRERPTDRIVEEQNTPQIQTNDQT
jgi:hypothetical protein